MLIHREADGSAESGIQLGCRCISVGFVTDLLRFLRHASVAILTVAAIVTMVPRDVAAQQRNQPQRQLTADSAAGNYLAALLADAKREPAASSLFYREALRADPRNAELLERAFVATLADGNMAEAFRLAERVVQREQANPLAQLTLAVRAFRNRQYVTARGHLNRAGAQGRNPDLPVTLLLAWTHVGTGELKRALEIVDKLNDQRLAVYRNFFGGLMADVAGARQTAGQRFKAAFEAERTTIRVADAHARFEARHGSRDAANAIYAQLAEVPSNKPFIEQTMKGLAAGNAPEPLVQNVPQGAAEVLYGAGDTGGRQGAELTALVYVQLALHLHPQSDIMLATLAENFEAINQYERAVELYGRVDDESGLKLRSTIRAAYALEQLNRGDDAVKRLEEQAARTPTEISVFDALAALHRGKKRWPEAIDASSKAIALVNQPNRQHWNLFYGRGIAYERAKQWPLAEADFKKALELLPDNARTEAERRNRAQVLNYLAYSWVDMGMNIDEAFVMLKRAVELQPRDGYIVDSLGWAYYKLEKYEDAVRELERAVDLRPADPVINDHLGDAFWKVGRRNEARFQWNHARDLKPEPEELEKILKKIEGGLEAVQPAAANQAQPAKPDGG
jgi:tetratricopeptide (TPR) repeat protein